MKIKITDHFSLSELISPDNGEILIDDLFYEHMALLLSLIHISEPTRPY